MLPQIHGKLQAFPPFRGLTVITKETSILTSMPGSPPALQNWWLWGIMLPSHFRMRKGGWMAFENVCYIWKINYVGSIVNKHRYRKVGPASYFHFRSFSCRPPWRKYHPGSWSNSLEGIKRSWPVQTLSWLSRDWATAQDVTACARWADSLHQRDLQHAFSPLLGTYRKGTLQHPHMEAVVLWLLHPWVCF